MAVSPSILDDLNPFAPRTPHIIGREAYINAIRDAIANKTGRSYVFYFVGPGGIGKTRILEEVEVIRKEWIGTPFLWSGIIDLYHADHHSPTGLREAIIVGLDPNNDYFQGYHKLWAEFEQKLEAGIGGPELEALRNQLDKMFQKEYAILAEKQRLVLCFDTLELIQYESDVVQDICQVQDVDVMIKDWLLKNVGRFPNTVTLFAGRPRPTVQDDFKQGFTQAKRIFKLFELEGLTQLEAKAYLNFMRQQRPYLDEILTPERQEVIIDNAEGRPIYLALLVDLSLDRDTLYQIDFMATAPAEGVDKNWINKQFFDYFLELSSPFHEMIYFLMRARKGLDTELLGYLIGDKWSEVEIQQNLDRMRQFALVKTRPGTGQLFLHDEVYDLFDLYFRDDPLRGGEYKPIAQYYSQKLNTPTSILAREEVIVPLLYYQLQIDARTGYHHYYARWDEEAIKSHETDFDMRLRDEVLRFMDRYTKTSSFFYDKLVADRVDRAAIDRDCAVRWVNRYILTQRKFDKARRVAEDLRNSSHPAFNWDTIDDPFYEAGLLTAWGEALLYLGEPEARELLEQAVQLLENTQEGDDEDQRWWRARILGRAHNNLGYFYRYRGRHGLALEQYRRALPYYTQANIPDERAVTLNNLAYLLALLGRVKPARRHIEEALRIRQQIGRQYPIALSRNTLGRIYVLDDQPMPGERECSEALRICEELQEMRGIGLAYNGLGFALRKWGDQWKRGVFSQQEAEQSFQEADNYLKRAVNLFTKEVREPIRLWEAYNELGSLYCDWGWLTRHLQDSNRADLEQKALKQYAQSIEYQNQALDIAQKHDLPFQVADSYDDLAQVYGDQVFLFVQLGQLEKARQSRATALTYFDQVESMVPEVFHLVRNEGFQAASEPGETYWLSLGKAYMWRGVWAFRDLQVGILPEQEREATLQQAIRQLILAVAYFQRYWPVSYALERTLDYVGDLLQTANVSAEWALEQMGIISEEYKLDPQVVDLVEEVINDTLGL